MRVLVLLLALCLSCTGDCNEATATCTRHLNMTAPSDAKPTDAWILWCCKHEAGWNEERADCVQALIKKRGGFK